MARVRQNGESSLINPAISNQVTARCDSLLAPADNAAPSISCALRPHLHGDRLGIRPKQDPLRGHRCRFSARTSGCGVWRHVKAGVRGSLFNFVVAEMLKSWYELVGLLVG